MKRLAILVSAAIVGAGLTSATVVQAAPLEGSWSGVGYVSPSQGKRERVRCRVSYSRQTPKVYSVNATCASPSAQIRQSGTLLKVSSKSYVGEIYNSEFDISGRVRVVVSGSRQTVTFSSSGANGKLNLRRR